MSWIVFQGERGKVVGIFTHLLSRRNIPLCDLDRFAIMIIMIRRRGRRESRRRVIDDNKVLTFPSSHPENTDSLLSPQTNSIAYSG